MGFPTDAVDHPHPQRPFHRSRPAGVLLATVPAVAGVTVILPFSPLNYMLGMTPLPLPVALILWLITMLYVTAPNRRSISSTGVCTCRRGRDILQTLLRSFGLPGIVDTGAGLQVQWVE